MKTTRYGPREGSNLHNDPPLEGSKGSPANRRKGSNLHSGEEETPRFHDEWDRFWQETREQDRHDRRNDRLLQARARADRRARRPKRVNNYRPATLTLPTLTKSRRAAIVAKAATSNSRHARRQMQMYLAGDAWGLWEEAHELAWGYLVEETNTVSRGIEREDDPAYEYLCETIPALLTGLSPEGKKRACWDPLKGSLRTFLWWVFRGRYRDFAEKTARNRVISLTELELEIRTAFIQIDNEVNDR